MVRTIIALTTVVLSVALVAGFSVQWARDRNRTYSLVLATGGQRGEYYAFGQTLAQVVADREPKIQIKVVATEGSQQNLALLEQDRAQMALVQSDEPLNQSARAIAFLFPEMFHLIARSDSNINQVSDLKSKRIALMPEGSGSYRLFWPLSQHYGLARADLQTSVLAPAAAHAALERGEVDALFRIVALGNPAVNQLLQTNRIRLVPIDQAEALQLFLPALEASQIPKGTYNGAVPIPAEDLPVVAVRSLLVVRQDVDRNVVNAIARSLFESRNELVKRNPQSSSIRQPESLHDLGLSFHPGAQDYYNQDEPNFFVEYAEPMGLLLSITMLCASGLWQFRIWLQGKQKNRADLYNLEIVALIEQVGTIDDLAELDTLRQKLFDIFAKVVSDLDEDRISPESFQSFTFPWEVAVSTLRHREFLLMNLSPPNPSAPAAMPGASASTTER